MYALVTGASAGIGMEMAKYLGTLGYDLILSARSEDRLEQTRRVILARYSDRSVHLLPADLSRREECFRLYRDASALAGDDGISFVANNAGMGVYGLFLETDLEKELDLIDLNVASVHILSKLFLRDMVKKGRGVLLNVGSCAGFMAGQIEVGVVLNKDKAFYVLEDGTPMSDYNGITVAEKYYGTYSFKVKAGKTYIVTCAGSKLGFYGFNYTYTADGTTVGINEIGTLSQPAVEGIFTLSGQRLDKPQKGLNIINGRKVMVK